jgi:hypothetical protein
VLKRKVRSEKAKKIKAKQCEMKRKEFFLVLQKQAKMKRNKMRFASFRFEAKIKKERKRDTLGTSHCFWTFTNANRNKFRFVFKCSSIKDTQCKALTQMKMYFFTQGRQ